MNEALSLQAYKPMIQGHAALSKESLLALGVSFILHVGLMAWFLGGASPDRPVSQTTALPMPVTVSIVALAGDIAPTPETLEELEAEVVSNIEPESGSADVKPELKSIETKTETTPEIQPKTSVPAPEAPKKAGPVKKTKPKTQPRKQAVTAPGGQKQQAVQQGSFTTSGTHAGKAGYHDKIRAWLEKHKTYPRRARLKGIEGIVAVDFTMNSKGQVLSKRVSKTSGHIILDKAALEAVEQAAPLPAIPSGFSQSTMSLSVSFSFFLS